ncbi:hypothetical protein Bbelb_417310 [Branchiostoma belcheri]|nr:hypothetical protein Bbelb_417310 [Branchiostoma belcheri]
MLGDLVSPNTIDCSWRANQALVKYTPGNLPKPRKTSRKDLMSLPGWFCGVPLTRTRKVNRLLSALGTQASCPAENILTLEVKAPKVTNIYPGKSADLRTGDSMKSAAQVVLIAASLAFVELVTAGHTNGVIGEDSNPGPLASEPNTLSLCHSTPRLFDLDKQSSALTQNLQSAALERVQK